MNAPTIPAQLVTCINGHPVPNLLAACRLCLAVELDFDVADDRRAEARDDD